VTDSVAPHSQLLPTDLARLPVLLAYTQQLDLRRWLEQPKRGIATLVLATCWLVLAWHGSGRPEHAALLNEPLLWTLIGRDRPPSTSTLLRALCHFSAHAVRRAVETSYLATLEGSCGRLWVSLDSHQMPYYGRLRRDQFLKGWSGNHSRALRGYRLYLAVEVNTGQVVTFLLVRGGAKDARLGPVLAAHVRQLLGRRLAGVVGDCGFSSHGSLVAMRRLRIPFIFGFGRSPQVTARLKALSRQQLVALRAGGAIRLGDCPWDDRLCLFRRRHPHADGQAWPLGVCHQPAFLRSSTVGHAVPQARQSGADHRRTAQRSRFGPPRQLPPGPQSCGRGLPLVGDKPGHWPSVGRGLQRAHHDSRTAGVPTSTRSRLGHLHLRASDRSSATDRPWQFQSAPEIDLDPPRRANRGLSSNRRIYVSATLLVPYCPGWVAGSG
jgi:hypothetical protein